MPLYVYKCPDCGQTVEKLAKYADPDPTCPVCEKRMAKAPARTSFVLKGGGWFKDGGY